MASTAPRVRATSETAALRIQLLGGFRVQVDARPVPDLARRAAALLKLLALAPGHRLHREEVLDLLWPELEPAAAANNLHGTMHALRQQLEPARPRGAPSAYLALRDEVLVLHAPGGLWVDVEAFDVACTIAHDSREPAAYHTALELYRGDLLPADRYADWAAGRRERLRERYLHLLLALGQLYQQRNEPWAAIRVLEQLVTDEPADEAAHVLLMRLHVQVGQRQRALRQYQQLVAALERELDVEPEEATQRLQAEILVGTFPPSPQARASEPPAVAVGATESLTRREQEVVQLLARGLTNRQIAAALGLRARTAETHVGRILRKLGVGSRTAARAWALQHGQFA